jgi:hypothetical protein
MLLVVEYHFLERKIIHSSEFAENNQFGHQCSVMLLPLQHGAEQRIQSKVSWLLRRHRRNSQEKFPAKNKHPIRTLSLWGVDLRFMGFNLRLMINPHKLCGDL